MRSGPCFYQGAGAGAAPGAAVRGNRRSDTGCAVTVGGQPHHQHIRATVDDVGATAGVGGVDRDGLKHKQVVIHDDFRLLQNQEEEPPPRDPALPAHRQEARHGRAVKAHLLPVARPRSNARHALGSAIRRFGQHHRPSSWVARVHPSGAAALREQMHGDEPSIRYVLLIKATAGSSSQVIDQRPLWFADRFTTVSSLGLTYLMIDTKAGGLVCGGSVGGALWFGWKQVRGTADRHIVSSVTGVCLQLGHGWPSRA